MEVQSKNETPKNSNLGDRMDKFYEWFVPRYLLAVAVLAVLGAGGMVLLHAFKQ